MTSQQQEQIERVNARIGHIVKGWCDRRLADGSPEFRLAELEDAIELLAPKSTPGSAGRILRDLRQRGEIAYENIDRSASLYRLRSIEEPAPVHEDERTEVDGANGGDPYAAFIARKSESSAPVGITRDVALGDHLFDFQRAIVRWALRRGRAAIFADCGMGKGPMALEWAHVVASEAKGRVLILAPLAVAQQFIREGEKFGRPVVYAREQSDAGDAPVVVTNYERLRHFNAADFVGVVLDESSIIKHHDAKTRAALIEAFGRTPYRLACTATPAPNDHMELGNHAEFLGVMTLPEMLSMYFVHDGGETQKWRLKGHAETPFWRWVCSWAVMIRKPSDLGFSDGSFVLPPLVMKQHVVDVEHDPAKAGTLFPIEARSMAERRGARKSSIDDRVRKCAEIVAADPNGGPWLIWCSLNAEGDALEKAIAGGVQVAGSDTDEHKTKAAIDFAEGRVPVLVSKSSIFGFGLNFQSCARVAFVGLSDSYEAFYQAIRRCWRFGQTRAVECHVITAETEGAVVANIERKERDALAMADAMVAQMRDAMQVEIRGASKETAEYAPAIEMIVPAWLTSEAA